MFLNMNVIYLTYPVTVYDNYFEKKRHIFLEISILISLFYIQEF